MASVAEKKAAIEAAYPLTPLQEGLLFHSIYAPGTGEYHDQFSALLHGALRPDLLAAAWIAVVAATPVLRTAFSWKTGAAPLQAVLRQVETGLQMDDWRAVPPAEHAARREQLRADDLSRPFDLSRAPLTRAYLVRLTDESWFFVWSRHHLLLDGWSVALVLRTWLSRYRELGGARPPGALAPTALNAAPPLPSPPPFQTYVTWLKGQDPSAAQAYWTGILAGLEGATGIGLAAAPGSPLPDGLTRHGEIDLRWSPEESAALDRFTRSCQVTAAALIQGAWSILLARLTGDREVVFGCTVSGRPAELPGVETMVGLFINTIPLRLRLVPDLSLAEWLQSVQSAAAAARQFEHTPLVQIQGWSGVPRDRALFESLLVVENYPTGDALAAELGDVRVEGARSHERTHYPVTLIAAPGPELSLRLLHDRSRISDAQAQQWIEGFQTVLRGMMRGGEQPVGRLSVLGPAEQARWLSQSNPPLRSRDQSATLVSLVAAQVARTPQATAVVDEHRRLTYAQLQREARELAAQLVAAGAGPERCVGVCLERSADLVVALLAVLEAGAVYVPLDPAYPPERLAFMAGDAQLVALVIRPELENRLPSAAIPVIRWSATSGRAGIPPGQSNAPQGRVPPHPSNLAYLIYTSGSTGKPKAAAIEHRQAAALIDWALTKFSRAELSGVFFSTSICFDLSVFELFVTLAAGGKVIVAENALALPTHPARNEVTLVNTVPSAAAELARQEAFPPSVTTICLAGEPLTAALADRLYSFPSIRRVCDLYGPSEDTTYSTYTQRVPGESATIGRVIDHSQLYLLDDDLAVAPQGAVGEIHLAGEGLARGYLGRPDLTAERFIPDPFSARPGGRLYRTGDLARFRPDGQLEYLGRRDHQVKIRGFRIELGEIQARLEAHPAVAEAAILAREHPTRGKYLAAFIAAQPGADARVESLSEWIRGTLPAYMLPATWHFLPRLPRTPNGKLDRAQLPSDSGTVAERGSVSSGAMPSGPRTTDPLEEIVAGIWAEVLAVGSVGPADHFFELGGHSLLATQAIARVRRALQIEIPLRALFEHPTLGDFAATVRVTRLGLSEAGSAAIPVRSPDTAPPLSFGQERLWTLARLAGDGAYHVPAALELSGSLDRARLEQALRLLVERHEALRMTFPEQVGLPTVRVAEQWTGQLDSVDLQGLPAAEREVAASRLAQEESWAPFDLATGPLLRARLIQLEPERCWLLLTVHHIATDGWSEWILVRELGALYAGRELDSVPVRYGDFAQWQRDRLQRGELADQIGWWKGELAGLPAIEWPADGKASGVGARTQRGGRKDAALDAIEAEILRGLARRENATLFMVLMAVWELWLWRRTGCVDFGVGVPVAGRLRRDLESVVGLLVNTVVLRSDLGEGLTFSALVGKVRERTLRAFDRQEAPFAQVIEAVQPRRDLNHSPLFQVMFVLQNNPRAELQLGEVTATTVAVDSSGSKFDLGLIVVERPDGSIGLSLEFSRDLFSDAAASAALAEVAELVRETTAGAGTDPLTRWAPPPELVRGWSATSGRAEELAVDVSFAAPLGPVEQLLAALWQELLPAERIGRFDNFFGRGGDSILALQVAARAAQAGYKIPAQAVFEHQTIADLASRAEPIGRSGVSPLPSGPGDATTIPLTPIQSWFFEQNFAEPAHWNQSALYTTAPNFDPTKFELALRQLARRHDALRQVFTSDKSKDRVAEAPQHFRALVSIAFEPQIAVEHVAAADLSTAINRAQAGLDPTQGLLLRAVCAAPVAAGGEGRLLLVVHHLAIDLVSWPTLLAELMALYAEGWSAPSGRAGPLPPTWSHWATAIAAEALRPSPEADAELDYWTAAPTAAPLPRDVVSASLAAPATARGLERDQASIEAALTLDETTRLLDTAQSAYYAQINELVLTALALTLREWTGSSRSTIALENHGREDFPGSPAAAGAIGWFTALFPLALELPPGSKGADAVQAIKQQLRAVPRRGFGYGLLRYAGSPAARAALGGQATPEICLNYAGQLDAELGASTEFRVAEEPRGADHGPANARPFVLEIFAAIRGGALRCTWNYSTSLHSAATVQRLADRCFFHLRALVAASDSAGAASADFAPSGLSSTDLAKILGRLR